MQSENAAAFVAAILNSSLFYWWYSAFSDCEHVNDALVRTSAFDNLEAARANLKVREGLAHVNGIGFARKGRASSTRAIERHPKAVTAIEAWLAASDFDAVIWTALASNFAERAGEDFSVEAALRFLEALPEDQLPRALEYIHNAPEPVQTPVRAAVSARWPEA